MTTLLRNKLANPFFSNACPAARGVGKLSSFQLSVVLGLALATAVSASDCRARTTADPKLDRAEYREFAKVANDIYGDTTFVKLGEALRSRGVTLKIFHGYLVTEDAKKHHRDFERDVRLLLYVLGTRDVEVSIEVFGKALSARYRERRGGYASQCFTGAQVVVIAKIRDKGSGAALERRGTGTQEPASVISARGCDSEPTEAPYHMALDDWLPSFVDELVREYGHGLLVSGLTGRSLGLKSALWGSKWFQGPNGLVAIEETLASGDFESIAYANVFMNRHPMTKDKNENQRLAEALALLVHDSSRNSLEELLPWITDQSEYMRSAALMAVKIHPDQHALAEVFVNRLRQAEKLPTRERILLIKTVGVLRISATVPLLIDSLDAGWFKGGVERAAHEALVAITGVDNGTDDDDWREWLRKKKGSH